MSQLPVKNGSFITILSGQYLTGDTTVVPYIYGDPDEDLVSMFINTNGKLPVPSQSVMQIFLLEWGGPDDSSQYTTIPDTTRTITTGDYVGITFILNGPQYLQTGGESANNITYQDNSWNDGSGDSEFRVFNFVDLEGNGFLNTESDNSNPRTFNGSKNQINYGQIYYLQSVGKAVGKNDFQYWQTTDIPRNTVLGTSGQFILNISDPLSSSFPSSADPTFKFLIYNNQGQFPSSANNTNVQTNTTPNTSGNANTNSTSNKLWLILGGAAIVIVFIFIILAIGMIVIIKK